MRRPALDARRSDAQAVAVSPGGHPTVHRRVVGSCPHQRRQLVMRLPPAHPPRPCRPRVRVPPASRREPFARIPQARVRQGRRPGSGTLSSYRGAPGGLVDNSTWPGRNGPATRAPGTAGGCDPAKRPRGPARWRVLALERTLPDEQRRVRWPPASSPRRRALVRTPYHITAGLVRTFPARLSVRHRAMACLSAGCRLMPSCS